MELRKVLSWVSTAVLIGLTISACGASTAATPSGAATAADFATVQQTCKPTYADQVKQMVDTSRFNKPAPWVLGVAAGDLESSYIVYMLQEIKYAVSKDSRYSKVIVLNANFNAATQVSQIESLISQKVSAIIFWPADINTVKPALQKALDAGIPTIAVANGYSDSPAVTADAQVDFYDFSLKSAVYLFNSMKGRGNIVQVETIPGISGNTAQVNALKCAMGFFPAIKLLDSQPGKFSQATTKVVAAAWAQRFAGSLDAIYSVNAEPSLGAGQAFDQAGALGNIKFAPANEENGWLKFLKQHPGQNLGVLKFPVTLGETGVGITTKVLQGQSVPRGTFIGEEYLTPDQAAAMAQPNQPDSWWPDSDLPSAYLPG